VPNLVDGFIYENSYDAKHDGQLVQLVGRVTDERLSEVAPAFFICFQDKSVGIATSTMLSPWFAH
jgi:hypothetical protein